MRDAVRTWAWISVVAAASLGLDLLTKAWAFDHLRLRGSHLVVPGVLHFEFAFNTGSAFGFLSDAAWGRGFLIAVSLAVVAYLLRLASPIPRPPLAALWGIGLAVGGALGNLHDRLFRTLLVFGEGLRHGVVDFIVVFYWPGRRWPAFNVADVCILLGMGLLVLHLHRTTDR